MDVAIARVVEAESAKRPVFLVSDRFFLNRDEGRKNIRLCNGSFIALTNAFIVKYCTEHSCVR